MESNMHKQNFSFLLVGAGGMGILHAEGFQKLGCKLISVVDIDENKAKSVAAKLNAIRWSLNYDAELGKSDFDFVVITTWPSSHASLATKALNASKHVICEKPIAHTLEDAKEMILAAKQSNSQLFVGHCLRYEEPWNTIVKAIHKGAIGKPLVMRMAGNQMTFGDIWKTQQRLIMSSSPIIDCGVHYVDLMRWLVQAEAVEVYATGAKTAVELPEGSYNYGMLQVKFADGSIGYYEAGWGPTMTKNAWYIKDLIGPKGSYSILYDVYPDEPDMQPQTLNYTLRLQQIPGPNPVWQDVKISEEIIQQNPGKANILAGEQNFFIENLVKNRNMFSLLEDAYKALEIVVAADRSIRTGKVIRIDEL